MNLHALISTGTSHACMPCKKLSFDGNMGTWEHIRNGDELPVLPANPIGGSFDETLTIKAKPKPPEKERREEYKEQNGRTRGVQEDKGTTVRW